MLRKNLDDLQKYGQKGDWCFLMADSQMALMYGNSFFEDLCILDITEEDKLTEWQFSWNGDKESPTLNPSIGVEYKDRGGARLKEWSGWLTAGELIEV